MLNRMRFNHPGWLLGLLLAALWPHWLWMARRTGDGSDEPWGVVALIVLAALVAMDWCCLTRRPRGKPLALAGGFAVASAAATFILPPIVAAALAMLGLVALLDSMLPPWRPRLALVGMALAALPLTASLNFYLGYPLRLLCAQGAAALLGLLGKAVTADGAALLWNGQTILVDAPCAGIAMLWVGLFAATLFSYLNCMWSVRTMVNVFAALLVVLAANIVRNTLLFFKEAGIVRWPEWSHAAIGLLVFGLALLVIYWIASRRFYGLHFRR